MAITCGQLLNGGESLVFSTENGIYLSNRINNQTYEAPTRQLNLKLTTYLEILEEQQLALALADGTLYAFPLEGLLLDGALSSRLKRGKRVCHCNYMAIGIIDRGNIEENVDFGEEAVWSRVLLGEVALLQLRKQVSVPAKVDRIFFTGSSRVYLETNMGLQILALDTVEIRPLLDASDARTQLDGKDSKGPVYTEFTTDGLLLSCSDISIYIDHDGRRAREDWKIEWNEPFTAAVTLMEMWIVAFSQTGVEARDIDTGTVVFSREYGKSRLLKRRMDEDEENCSVIALLRLQENQNSPGLQASSGLDISELLRVDVRALGSA
ncbi:hypothetical protein M409DRAFT_27000 [Zasmidium cellare ATCC 36951]|uniref:CNH domain-containing protein n=1 Tax=Zasmidium cellare ATCC 36951 TaxID=1080233 RepID=A0A6A6CA35_ZASCE|nr:uncharacterized protein M409DRAFT_27000 [Zasmidium cellare ATCC 36951]KAF2162762.1 hypothetical protein M409DRAFT_27000 [Zasmidium cellare ATCC 36951]